MTFDDFCLGFVQDIGLWSRVVMLQYLPLRESKLLNMDLGSDYMQIDHPVN